MKVKILYKKQFVLENYTKHIYDIIAAHRCKFIAPQNGWYFHDDDIKWNIFRVTGHLCGEFTDPWWIPRTKTRDAKLWCFLQSASE